MAEMGFVASGFRLGGRTVDVSGLRQSKAARKDGHGRCRSGRHRVRMDARGESTAGVDTGVFAEERRTMESGEEVWTRNWVPLWTLDDLSEKKPRQVVVLGKEYVIYRSSDKWIVQRDVCPHRLAPLSEGRIDEDGHIQCPYHGWSFGTTGQCIRIPQAACQRTACAQVPVLETFPVREGGGLLWSWLDSDTASESSSVPLPLPAIAADPAVSHATFLRFLPLEWETLLENIVDPSHVPWAHHGVQGNRYRAGVDDVTINRSMEGEGQGFKAVTSKGGPSFSFKPPYMVHYTLTMASGNTISLLTYSVPVRPGLTTLLYVNSVVVKKGLAFKAVAALTPRWMDHLIRNLVLDGDTLFLPFQETQRDKMNFKAIHVEDASSMSSPPSTNEKIKWYHIATAADRGVLAFQKWFRKYSQGRVPFVSGTAPRRDLHPVGESNAIQRSSVIDRYEQHTKHCSSCNTALRNFRRLIRVLAWFAALTTVLIAATAHILRWKVLVLVVFIVLTLFTMQYIEDNILPLFIWRDYDHAQ